VLPSGERVLVDPTVTTSRIFLYFYLCINIGSLVGQIGMVSPPLALNLSRYPLTATRRSTPRNTSASGLPTCYQRSCSSAHQSCWPCAASATS
jgi:hypothetical protein